MTNPTGRRLINRRLVDLFRYGTNSSRRKLLYLETPRGIGTLGGVSLSDFRVWLGSVVLPLLRPRPSVEVEGEENYYEKSVIPKFSHPHSFALFGEVKTL